MSAGARRSVDWVVAPSCNTCKVSVFGRKLAIQKFTEEIRTNPKLREHLPRLSGKRLICHCLPSQECHADSIIAEHKLLFPDAKDREDTKGAVPSSAVLRRLSELRQEPESEGEGSSPDENVMEKGSGWTGRGSPLMVGSSCTVHEVCDGQSLASPGRWAVEDRRYPEDPVWSEVSRRYMDYAERAGTLELLTSLALGKVSSCPFPHAEIEELKRGVVDYLQTEGFLSGRHPEDRTDVPIDFRYLALLLRVSSDPEISLGDFFLEECESDRGRDFHDCRRSISGRGNCLTRTILRRIWKARLSAIQCGGKTTLRLRSMCPESWPYSMIRAAGVRH